MATVTYSDGSKEYVPLGMSNVHGRNEHKETHYKLVLPPWSAFNLTFWPALAVIAVALISKLV